MVLLRDCRRRGAPTVIDCARVGGGTEGLADSVVSRGLRALTSDNKDNRSIARSLDDSLAELAGDMEHPMQRGHVRGRTSIDEVV